MKKTSILIIDDESNIRLSLCGLLGDYGYECIEAENGYKGLDAFTQGGPDIVLLDVKLPDTSGVDVLKKILSVDPAAKVIMMSGEADVSTAVGAIQAGALNFLEKPLNPDKLLISIGDTVERIALEKKVNFLEEMADTDFEIIGNSNPVKQLRKLIHKAASSDSRVLLFGENGSGKELVARSLHGCSSRKDEAFISLNCAAIPDSLVESELFGYEKGAFTGAVQRKKGRIEDADGGTLFLDEVGDMGLLTQAKLLRVLETNQAVRVGGTKPYTFDVRIIAATNKDLARQIENGNFREDLYYRLNVVPVTVPPLRDRTADIPLLAGYFLKKSCRRLGKPVRGFTRGAIEVLSGYEWPGNVRELKNIVERIIILSDDTVVSAETVDAIVPGSRPDSGLKNSKIFPADGSRRLADMVAGFEKEILAGEYTKCSGNVSQMAKNLDTDRANLYRKLKKFGIK